MKAPGIFLILGALSCSPEGAPIPTATKPSTPVEQKRPGVSLALRVSVLGEPHVGQSVSFQIRLINVGTRDVDVVPPLDGSDVGFRYPLYEARILGPDGNPVPRDDGGCGNVNAFRQEDLVELKPGDELDPLLAAPLGHWLSGWTPERAGRHVLHFAVDLTADEAKEWCGPESSTERESVVRKLIARVPRQKLVAVAEFDVAERLEPSDPAIEKKLRIPSSGGSDRTRLIRPSKSPR